MRPITIREEDGSAMASQCHLCEGEIFEGEQYYRISGENICTHCLRDFAEREFAAFTVTGGEKW